MCLLHLSGPHYCVYRVARGYRWVASASPRPWSALLTRALASEFACCATSNDTSPAGAGGSFFGVEDRSLMTAPTVTISRALVAARVGRRQPGVPRGQELDPVSRTVGVNGFRLPR